MKKRNRIVDGFHSKINKRRGTKMHVNEHIKMMTLRACIEAADRYCSAYIIRRDGECVTCGTRDGLTNSHLFKRGRMELRFDPYNCNCQCATCNGIHNTNQEPYNSWFKRKYGEDKFTELQVKSRQIAKLNRSQVRAIAMLYQAKLKNIH